jgi:hypothetical protein
MSISRFHGSSRSRRARRGSPDPAAPPDRRSPIPQETRAERVAILVGELLGVGWKNGQ